GLALLLQTTLALMPIGAAVLLAWRHRRPAVRALGHATALAGGVCLAIAPAVARNVAVGVPPLAFASVTPIVFLSTNLAGYRPDVGFAADVRETARVMGDTGGRLLPVVRETLATHSGPWSYLGQLGAKLAVMWHWYELPDNT